jgi:hypothetical protein
MSKLTTANAATSHCHGKSRRLAQQVNRKSPAARAVMMT